MRSTTSMTNKKYVTDRTNTVESFRLPVINNGNNPKQIQNMEEASMHVQQKKTRKLILVTIIQKGTTQWTSTLTGNF